MRKWGGWLAGTNYQGLAVWGPNYVAHIFVFLSIIVNYWLQINPLRSNPCHFAIENTSFQYSVKIFSWSSLVGGPRDILSLRPNPTVGYPGCLVWFRVGTPTSQDIPWFSPDPQGNCYTKASWMTYTSFPILNTPSHINAVYSKPMTACLNLQYYLKWMNMRQQIFFSTWPDQLCSPDTFYLRGLGSSLPRDEISSCENHLL
jgi:hypothetical protein